MISTIFLPRSSVTDREYTAYGIGCSDILNQHFGRPQGDKFQSRLFSKVLFEIVRASARLLCRHRSGLDCLPESKARSA